MDIGLSLFHFWNKMPLRALHGGVPRNMPARSLLLGVNANCGAAQWLLEFPYLHGTP